jgi:hypothetical protein
LRSRAKTLGDDHHIANNKLLISRKVDCQCIEENVIRSVPMEHIPQQSEEHNRCGEEPQ